MRLKLNNACYKGGMNVTIMFFFLFCSVNIIYAQSKIKNQKPGSDSTAIDTSFTEFSTLSLPEFTGKEQKVFPPTPTAASLGRYGEIPVTMYSGIPNIEIPLFELESTKLSLPISMSYHATGVKVEEIPGWVGLGWALNAGGVITRTVNNLKDELPDVGYIDYCENIPSSYYNASCDFLMTIAAGDDGFVDDAEPDIFFYNFPGETGKFVFGGDGTPKLMPYKKLDIQKQTGTIANTHGITSFIIKTPDGTKYEFGGSNAVEISTAQVPGPDPERFFSSWYLTRIVSSDLKDTIRFTYVGHTYKSDSQINHTMVCESNCGSHWSCSTLTPSTTMMTISAKKLSSIESKKGKIVFSIADRVDCNGGKKLTTISLYSKGAQYPYKYYSFSYEDVSSSPAATGYAGKRMFLDNITVKDSTSANIGKYTFSYYNRTRLPPRDSKGRDHWGFYNGATGNSTLIPASPTYGLSGANREPNESCVRNGILEKITYPTGGYTQFIYEAHKNSTTLLCGGVRIKEIYNFDGITTTKKKYTYGTGYLFFMPVYEYTVEVDDGNGNWCNDLIRQSYSYTVLGTSNGSYIGYPNVTEWIGLNGEGGKTERTYTHYYDQGNNSYPFSPGTSFDWARGHLIKEKHYSYNSGTFTLVEETNYDYGSITGNSQNSYDVKGLKVGYERIGLNLPCSVVFSSQRYQEYYHYSRWFYLKNKTKKTYLAGGTVIEDTKYYYANPIHAQITRKTETTSTGDSIRTFYYYPDDYPSLFDALKTNFVVGKPIDVRVYFNNQLISGQQFLYNNYGLPTTIYQARISSGGSIAFNSSNPYTFNTLMNITYNPGFNIQEITPVNDYPTTYLWSYGDTYPVMKIENASYSQVSSLAGSLISDLRNATTPSVINTKLSQIRNSLSSISTSTLITSYKYRNHIGISEISDPTGTKTKYFYDKFGRLKLVKDDEDRLLNQFIYNYVNK